MSVKFENVHIKIPREKYRGLCSPSSNETAYAQSYLLWSGFRMYVVWGLSLPTYRHPDISSLERNNMVTFCSSSRCLLQWKAKHRQRHTSQVIHSKSSSIVTSVGKATNLPLSTFTCFPDLHGAKKNLIEYRKNFQNIRVVCTPKTAATRSGLNYVVVHQMCRTSNSLRF